MRRIVMLGLLVILPGCTGVGEFLNHAFTPPGRNPNLPMADSENVRRSLGQQIDVSPLTPEAGNVWPGPQAPDPTLNDVQRQQPGAESARGFAPTAVPGAEPGLPAGRQPRPRTRGSSTPPGSVEPGLPPEPRIGVRPNASGAIMVPNGNGTSTIINPNGTVQTIPTPR